MQKIRKRAFEVLDIGARGDRLSRFVDIFLICLISLNVLSVILETLPFLQNRYLFLFSGFETFSVIIFSFEYVTRVWCSIENPETDHNHPFWGRLRYMLTPMALIDLIVILPFYLTLFFTVDLRFMRVLRLLRVFRLTRYSSSMSLLLTVLKDEAKSIGAALFVLCMLIIMASSLTYLAEHKAQPEAFKSIPHAMWWAIITMTSVGYGDVTPVTVLGKMLASVISIISVGLVALPAGILASGYSEAIRQRRVQFEKVVDDALEDGVITPEEELELQESRETLGLDPAEAETIFESSRNRKIDKEIGQMISVAEREMKTALNNRCPHCGKVVDWRHEKRSRPRSQMD